MTRHLDGLDWEVIVIKDDTVNAMCLPGGKIMVYTGFLDHFKTDAEVAAVLGHEVGHVIARHTAEMASKSLVSMFMRTGIRQFFDNPRLVKYVSKFLQELPLSRKYVGDRGRSHWNAATCCGWF
nr:mitochondrial metalloendopeptidase OMA1-like [Lolium perenne]